MSSIFQIAEIGIAEIDVDGSIAIRGSEMRVFDACYVVVNAQDLHVAFENPRASVFDIQREFRLSESESSATESGRVVI